MLSAACIPVLITLALCAHVVTSVTPPRYVFHNGLSAKSTSFFSTGKAHQNLTSLFRDYINPCKSTCLTGIWVATYNFLDFTTLVYSPYNIFLCVDLHDDDTEYTPIDALQPIGDTSNIFTPAVTHFTRTGYRGEVGLITQNTPHFNASFSSFVLSGEQNVELYTAENYTGNPVCVQSGLLTSGQVNATAVENLGQIGIQPGSIKSIRFVNTNCTETFDAATLQSIYEANDMYTGFPLVRKK